MEAETLIKGLLNPRAYPWPVTHVELIETHMSWVFLTDDRVFKVKRPVHYGFVDHRTLGARRASSNEEVRVNQRLTNGVYLETVPIFLSVGRVVVGGEGTPVEWGTLMRRLPAERMLDQLIAAGAVPNDFGRDLGSKLGSFHEKVASNCATSTEETSNAQLAVVTDNLAELRPFSGRLFSAVLFAEIQHAMKEFIEDHRPLLESRVDQGWIRDGHGDLRAEHVCLEENGAIQIFDAIEFSRNLRCADVASDLAFLLMDLKRLGREDLCRELLDQYAKSEVDLPGGLVRFYETHRALVRVKVNCLTVAGASTGEHAEEAVEVRRYLDTAFRTSNRSEPYLIIMTGLSGTGKSTVAGQLAWATGSVCIRSDEVRRSLTEDMERTSNWQTGAYSRKWTERTYQRMFELGEEYLGNGESVVLDATFHDQRFRDLAATVADELQVPMLVVETLCPESIVRTRLEARARQSTDPSEATYDTYLKQTDLLRKRPAGIPAGAHHVSVDTSNAGPDWLDDVYQALSSLNLFASSLRTS